MAANFIGEWEFESGPEELELAEIAPQITLAAAYSFSHALSLGLELRNHNEIAKEDSSDEMEWQHSALFLGPTVAYATKAWWMTFTVLPQIPALKSPGKGKLILDEHEAVEARFLLSFHL